MSIRGGDVKKGVKKLDVLEMFFIFVCIKGFCFVDLFRMIFKDGNFLMIIKNEFIMGMKKFNVLLKDY